MKLKIFIPLILLIMTNTIQAQEWYAMERHGGCINFEKLNEMDSLFQGAKSPHQIEEKLKIAGIDYTLEPMMPGQDGMLKLNVPSKGWGMIFVKKEFCQEFLKE